MLPSLSKNPTYAINIENRLNSLDDETYLLLAKNEELKKFLPKAIEFLKAQTDGKISENVAHYLMGKITELPAQLSEQKLSVPDEIRKELFDVLRTHRNGMFGIEESSDKTIAKLEKLNECIVDRERVKLATNRESQKIMAINEDWGSPPIKKIFTETEISGWLFGGDGAPKDTVLPKSQLGIRSRISYNPKSNLHDVPMLGVGKYSRRIGIYEGSITDLRAAAGENVALGCPNGGDLSFGLAFGVEKVVINAAGPRLQMDLYNTYGVPERDRVTTLGAKKYSNTEGRGYALTCNAHDMKESHGIGTVELLVVPDRSEEGLVNMYYQALAHSFDKDYIIMPMAGMTRPVIGYDPITSAVYTLEAIKRFQNDYPNSQLKIIFAIYDNSYAAIEYESEIKLKDLE